MDLKLWKKREMQQHACKQQANTHESTQTRKHTRRAHYHAWACQGGGWLLKMNWWEWERSRECCMECSTSTIGTMSMVDFFQFIQDPPCPKCSWTRGQEHRYLHCSLQVFGFSQHCLNVSTFSLFSISIYSCFRDGNNLTYFQKQFLSSPPTRRMRHKSRFYLD